MSRPRATVAQLQLKGAQHSHIVAHLNDKKLTLAKREQLEKVFADLQRSYRIAAADVEARGEVLTVTRYSSKGTPFEMEVFNPYWRIQVKLAPQLAAIAKLLSQYQQEPEKSNTLKPGSARDLMPALFKAKQ
jgi:hypothetical protein